MPRLHNASDAGIQAAATLIESFGEHLTAAGATFPSSRCLARPDLVTLVTQAKLSANLPALNRYSATQLMALLKDAGIIRPVPLTPIAPKLKEDRLYAIGLDVSAQDLDPAEILQAHIPQGVVCYFTAVELHGLTSQPAPHHHIARLRAAALLDDAAPAREPSADDRPYPLGTAQFAFEGVIYYVTHRDPKGLRQTQLRQLSPQCVVTITGLEQTLLDCLHRPTSCGGAAVVFEAWALGMAKTTPERIIALVQEMGDRLLARRVGYLLTDLLPNVPALERLRQWVGQRQHSPAEATPSLLPGIPYHRVNVEWDLRVP